MIKAIKWLAGIGGILGIAYLINDGSFGVNIETAIATAVPSMVWVLPTLIEVLQKVIPATVVSLIATKLKTAIGDDWFNFLKTTFNTVGASKIQEYGTQLTEYIGDTSLMVPVAYIDIYTKYTNGIYDNDIETKQMVETLLPRLKEAAEKVL